MKKVICMALAFMLIFVTSVTSFGQTVPPIATLYLNISSNPEDHEIIKELSNVEESALTKKDNNIEIKISDISEETGIVKVSGEIDAKLLGQEQRTTFVNSVLDIKYVDDTKFYTGCIELNLTEEKTILVDITCLHDFSKAIVGYTEFDEVNGTQRLMLYGDTFNEQKELYEDEILDVQENNDLAKIDEESYDVQPFATVKDTSKYEFVKNTYSKKLNGESTEKQMIVMSVSKCDPKDIGSGMIGYESIRVFSRSYNVPKVNAKALMAKPLRMKVKFQGDEGIMNISGTKPTSSSGTLQNVFKVFETVANLTGKGELASVAAAISSVGITGNTISQSSNTVTFDIKVSNKDVDDLDYTGGSNSAHTNTNKGVAFKVAYLEDNDYSSADITVTGNITYQVFLNTDRTASWKTGTAKVVHTVGLN